MRGPPMWSSVSLFGRGTMIWKAYHEENDQILVKGRKRESDIYELIKLRL